MFIVLFLTYGCFSNENREDENNKYSEEKEEYLNYISMYVNDVMVKIMDEIEYHYKETDTMLFIPVGTKITCASDHVLSSPFSKSWQYIYVGVYYDGEEYFYSVASKDGEGYGMDLTTRKELLTYDYHKIGIIKDDKIKEFVDLYKESIDGNKEYSISEVSKDLKKFVKANHSKVKKIVFIDPNECSYES